MQDDGGSSFAELNSVSPNVATATAADDLAGAISLLRDCVGGVSGERLLIVSEPEGNGFYDELAPKITAAAGRALGMRVYTTESDSFVNSEDEKAILIDGLRGFDHIVFFSRVGDQIRFTSSDELPPSTMCYTLNVRSLNSNFGTASHHGMCEIKAAIDRAFEAAEHISVTCPQGTEYGGTPRWTESPIEVGLKRFPLLVPRPVPADGLTGRIALSRFLIGTGNRVYEPYYLGLSEVVYACVEGNLITHFEGNRFEVERVENHYKRVADQLDINPWYVDSWHAGIHPGCHFEADAQADILRWSGTAFGNPRILHFHTCGEYAPGEISWNLLDPTITLDGVSIWESGRLCVDRLEEGAEILARHPRLAALFSNPEFKIGLDGNSSGLNHNC